MVFVLAVGTFAGVVGERKRRKALAKYFARTCTGFQWRRRFPAASKTEIRAFLDLFIEAFLFRRKHRLLFSPKDRVMDVYHACYPPDWSLGDNMELEEFVEDFRKTYSIDLVPLWREDITLGDLFALTQQRIEPHSGANAG